MNINFETTALRAVTEWLEGWKNTKLDKTDIEKALKRREDVVTFLGSRHLASELTKGDSH